MPDFPKPPGGGATAAEVWGYTTRKITALDGQPRTDLMGEDADFEAGTGTRKGRIDAAITTRAPESGGNVAAIKTKTDALPADPASDTQVNTRASATDYTAGRAAKLDKIQDYFEDSFGTLTADGTEQIVREATTLTKLHAYIDLTNMAAGDTTVVRQFMKIKAAGAYVKYAEETYTDAQSIPLLHVIMKPAKYGLKITLQQTAGTNRAYDWQTLKEEAAA